MIPHRSHNLVRSRWAFRMARFPPRVGKRYPPSRVSLYRTFLPASEKGISLSFLPFPRTRMRKLSRSTSADRKARASAILNPVSRSRMASDWIRAWDLDLVLWLSSLRTSSDVRVLRMVFSRRETILWLMVCLESRAPLKALKLFWYHARVAVVTFFRYFRSSINLKTSGFSWSSLL